MHLSGKSLLFLRFYELARRSRFGFPILSLQHLNLLSQSQVFQEKVATRTQSMDESTEPMLRLARHQGFTSCDGSAESIGGLSVIDLNWRLDFASFIFSRSANAMYSEMERRGKPTPCITATGFSSFMITNSVPLKALASSSVEPEIASASWIQMTAMPAMIPLLHLQFFQQKVSRQR